jgi:outer membrane porin, OprD family
MTPYTFEGVTVGGGGDGVQYLAGYLWKIKPRNSDAFISMAEQADAIGSDGGVGLIGVQLRPSPDLQIDISNQYGVDTFNTLYAKANYRYPLKDDWAIRLGAEFTDQRAAGAALVANAADKKWITQVGGARVQLIYRQLTLTGAFSITGSGNTIQNPWGTYPGFLSLIDAPAAQNFARANEKAWLIGAVYDFSALGMAGLVGTLNFASGTGAIDPQTRMPVPDQREFNFKIEYRPTWLASTILRGLQLTVRGALYDEEHSSRLARQIHVILDWEWGMLAPTAGTTGK